MRNKEVLAMNWRGKRDGYILSTIHDDTLVEIHGRGGPIVRPECVHDYNQFMGGG